MTIEHDTKTALVSLVGPADVWFGVGFDASAMADKPYAIIVDGTTPWLGDIVTIVHTSPGMSGPESRA